jgi:ATP-dependent RNA helicase RhlE
VKKILKVIPAKRQSLFFSATMPESIMQLAASILTDPDRVEVTPVSSTAETIQQEIFFVDASKKKDLLIHTLLDKSIVTALVFTRTKHGADKVVKILSKEGITAEAIHGNKSQNARQRALKNFKDHTTRVLVATDIAARGIDIDELAFVINYEIPNIPETYVHRIGRTGRAGSNGKAITFCDVDEREYLRDIQKLIDIELPVNNDHPYPAQNLIPEGKAKATSQSRNQRPVNHNKRQDKGSGNRTAGDSMLKADRNPKKKWSWQGNK